MDQSTEIKEMKKEHLAFAVFKVVSDVTKIHPKEFLEFNRNRHVQKARHLAFYLTRDVLKTMTNVDFAVMVNRNPTSITSSRHAAQDLFKTDKEFQRWAKESLERIKALKLNDVKWT